MTATSLLPGTVEDFFVFSAGLVYLISGLLSLLLLCLSLLLLRLRLRLRCLLLLRCRRSGVWLLCLLFRSPDLVRLLLRCFPPLLELLSLPDLPWALPVSLINVEVILYYRLFLLVLHSHESKNFLNWPLFGLGAAGWCRTLLVGIPHRNGFGSWSVSDLFPWTIWIDLLNFLKPLTKRPQTIKKYDTSTNSSDVPVR